MKPILLKGHERSITKVQYNREGDILFSVSKDNKPTAWWSDNGERIGTYNGHSGAVWDMDITGDSKLVITGSADASSKVFNTRMGVELIHIKQPGPCRAVSFSHGYQQFCTVSKPLKPDSRELPSLLCIFQTPQELLDEDNPVEPVEGYMPWVSVPVPEAIVAVYMPMNRAIMLGSQDGFLRLYRPEPSEKALMYEKQAHSKRITDIQFNADQTLFITSSIDCQSMLFDCQTMTCLKVYRSFVPINSACIHPKFEHIMFGGGQDAMAVTTTDSRQGNFEVRFFHMIFANEFGRVKGHFGPVNSLAFHPDGSGFSSGGEDGYVRLHHFTADYLTKQQKMDRKLEKADRLAKELEAKGIL